MVLHCLRAWSTKNDIWRLGRHNEVLQKSWFKGGFNDLLKVMAFSCQSTLKLPQLHRTDFLKAMPFPGHPHEISDGAKVEVLTICENRGK